MTFMAEIIEKKEDTKTENDTEDGEEGIVFDQVPVRVSCPYCGLSVITYIEHEASWVTYLAGIVILSTLGWAALCVLPIVFPLFKDVVHHCPRCLNVLATRSRVAISSIKSEVMSMRFGSCVIVLARKWVILLVGLMVLIGGVHAFRSRHNFAANPEDLPTRSSPLSLGWEDFNRDCGFKSYLGNPIHVTVAFTDKYKGKTFRWQGNLDHVEDGFTFLWWSQQGAVFVRMSPAQLASSRRPMPDLVLLFDEGAEQLAKQVTKLKKGQPFGFEASMAEVGRRGAPHTMVLWDIFPAVSNGTRADSIPEQV